MNRQDMRKRLEEFARTHMILMGISAAILIAFTLTLVSMWVYNHSDVARLDVSRPGYETVRESVVKGNEESKFDTSGPLDKKALETFQKLFNERREPLSNYGRFDGTVLNDDQLKLEDPTPPEAAPAQ